MDELKIAYAMFLTLPGVPFIYYGDEIGMRYFELPTKEGGYTRTGTRTPMQWSEGNNKGFSTAPADKLYLPVDETVRIALDGNSAEYLKRLKAGYSVECEVKY